ncbi:hypothetical protein RF55_24833 [Lasius niger]|uniref:DUF3627 domain-containing protein n=1 Tax=Lasius niger TaxID=67767 RepID=A0A0J7JVM2_LASNI|nr:hypothetical protein RF55_24833 [Lasius niger]
MLQRKIKEADEKMVQLTLEKTEELKVKDDKIDELKEIMLRLEKSREQDRQTMKRQEQYMRSLGISLEEVKDQNEELLDKTINLECDNKEVKRKLGIAVEDRAPLPVDKKKQERFVLMKRNDPDFLPYYTIRAQNAYTTRKLKIERLHFPNLEILQDFKAQPNSKTLYVRIKDELREKGVVFDGNNIDLEGSDVTEEELIEATKVINDSKRDV